MDYVLFGMGYGASLMLLGWALRTFGPQLKYRETPKEGSSEYLVEQRFWVRFIQGLGGVIAIGGTAMVLLTFIVVLINPSDSLGANIALVIWAVVMIAVLVWCWFYISKYGLSGIWSHGSGYGFRGQHPVTPVSTTPPREITARRITATNTIGPAPVESAELVAPASDGAADSDSEPGQSADIADDSTPGENDQAAAEDEPGTEVGPVYDFGDSNETTVPSDSTGRSEALRRMRERQARARQATNQH